MWNHRQNHKAIKWCTFKMHSFWIWTIWLWSIIKTTIFSRYSFLFKAFFFFVCNMLEELQRTLFLYAYFDVNAYVIVANTTAQWQNLYQFEVLPESWKKTNIVFALKPRNWRRSLFSVHILLQLFSPRFVSLKPFDGLRLLNIQHNILHTIFTIVNWVALIKGQKQSGRMVKHNDWIYKKKSSTIFIFHSFPTNTTQYQL